MRTFTLPTVNMNGSSAHELLDQQLRVLRAIDTLWEAMRVAAPHGRDYQLAPERYDSARSDFNDTVDALELIKERAQALAVHLSDVQDRRNA
jgi:hypothetical protein